jgi:LAO/AO transport system kinase
VIHPLAGRVLEGEIRAASRLMRLVDDLDPQATPALQALFPHTGRAYVVGVTGPPGAGKSTLTDRLIAHYRAAGKSVGVLAVDPTSPFTGGAILGDRIRMQGHATDRGVFIRSLATRGHLGGLSRATGDCLKVMDAMGREVIIVETVGVGQDEIEIAQLAHTTLVVLVPGMGDDIQAIKAGILEVADLFVVNKSDLEGSDRVVRELRGMLELRHAVKAPAPAQQHDARHRPHGAHPPPPVDDGEWEPPILKVVAARDEGVAELVAAVGRHRDWMDASGTRALKERSRASSHFVALLKERLLRAGLRRLAQQTGDLEAVAARIAARTTDPYALADELAGLDR